MTLQEFKDRIDVAIIDFVQRFTSEKEFRDAILDILLELWEKVYPKEEEPIVSPETAKHYNDKMKKELGLDGKY